MEEYKSKDVVGAIFLIFIGIIFLLNTTGFVNWSIWIYILKFWPAVLILIGLKLVFGRSIVADILISIIASIIFVIIGFISYIAAVQRDIPFLPNRVNEYIQKTYDSFNSDNRIVNKKFSVSNSEYENVVENRYVKLNIGGARFDMSDSSESSEYFSADSFYPRSYSEPRVEEKVVQKNKLEIYFTSASPSMFPTYYRGGIEYNLILGRTNLPTDIDISLGAGEGSVTLMEGVYKEISSSTGAGKLTMKFSERSIPSEELDIDVGAGEVILELPESVGYILDYDLGVGSIESSEGDIASFAAGDKTYESKNYSSAEHKIKITASVGVGSLVINRYK